jgi:hypothetical protein
VNRRQEVADIIRGSRLSWATDSEHRASQYAQAAAVLEHLDKPVDLKGPDLEAMNDLAVVMDDSSDVWQRRGGVWCGYEISDHSSTRLARYGPFRILYTGKATS